MRAVGINRYGGPEVLSMLDVAEPKPGKGEVVLKLKYTSVNRLDILVRSGYHDLKLSMPHILGADVYGVIDSIGEGVNGVQVGQKMMANTVFGCGKCQRCLAGEENVCRDWKTIGKQVNGSYAEKVKVPASVLVSPPSGFSEQELATMPLSLSTSWRAISVLGKGKKGDTVVIRGASGNVGIFSVQIAKKLGLTVIAMSRGEKKRGMLLNLGADYVLDSSEDAEKIAKEILKITGDRGADITVETSGATLGDSINFTSEGGRIVVFGTIQGVESNIKIPKLYLRGVEVFGMHNSSRSEFVDALNFASKNGIKPIIAKEMPLEKAADAQISLQESKYFGKIILKI